MQSDIWLILSFLWLYIIGHEEVAKLEAKKVKADQKAAEEAKKSEAEAVVKKLLAGGMSADEILEKLKWFY